MSLLRLTYLTLIATLVFACSFQRTSSPKLIVDKSVASDLHQFADEVWQKFLIAFDARASCFGDVTLRTSKAIADRALYEPSAATVTVKVPATPGVLEGALIHEWAHHIEHQCEAHKTMRPAFLAAQKLPLDSEWYVGDDWADTPSEQYAEAAILMVLGERTVPTEIRVSAEAVRVLENWATTGE